MEATHLDTVRTDIISMGYSSETLKNAVLRSREDIRESRVVTIDEMRRKHPRI